MFGIGFAELSIILLIVLVLFGPAKLPQLGSAFGKTIREFKGGLKEIDGEATPVDSDEGSKENPRKL